MTDLTDAQLDQIEARADAATAGPWKPQDFTDDPHDYGVGILGRADTVSGSRLTAYAMTYHDEEQSIADGEFIAAAREDVPALIAEVRRLRAAVSAVDEINRNLRAAVREDAYNCRCQVGGVDAMSIDTDWLKRITVDIHTALHPEDPRHD